MAGYEGSKYHPAWNDIDVQAWKLIDNFTGPDAAALLANVDPGAITYNKYDQSLLGVNYTDDIRPGRANKLFQQLMASVLNGELKATMPEPEPDFDVPF